MSDLPDLSVECANATDMSIPAALPVEVAASPNPATVPGLPAELIASICYNLDARDVRALRLVNRRLAQSTMGPFSQQFKVIRSTCSFEGLVRLEELASNIKENKLVEEVSIHVLDDDIDDMIETFVAFDIFGEEPAFKGRLHGPGAEDPCVRVHAWVRKILIETLKKFPKLKRLSVSNRAIGETRHNKCASHKPARKRPYAGALIKAFRETGQVKTTGWGMEVVLSILPDLGIDNLSLRLICTAHENQTHSYRPLWFDRPYTCHSAKVQQAIFGVKKLHLGPIIAKYLRHAELYNFQGIDAWRWEMFRALSASEIQSLKLISFSQNWHFAPEMKRFHFPHLKEFEYSHGLYDQWIVPFISNHAQDLESLTLTSNTTNWNDAWDDTFDCIADSTIERLCISNCSTVRPKGPDQLWPTVRPKEPDQLWPEKPVTTCKWVGNELVRSYARIFALNLPPIDNRLDRHYRRPLIFNDVEDW